jgi:hypothetical protein
VDTELLVAAVTPRSGVSPEPDKVECLRMVGFGLLVPLTEGAPSYPVPADAILRACSAWGRAG